jgi:hypothetical protein
MTRLLNFICKPDTAGDKKIMLENSLMRVITNLINFFTLRFPTQLFHAERLHPVALNWILSGTRIFCVFKPLQQEL